MSTKRRRYADHMKEWEETIGSVAANASDLPQLEATRAKLEKILGEARELTLQQAAHRSSKQQTSKRLQTLMSRGTKAATSMRAVLKEFYGHDNEKLTEFGLQPFRSRPRKAADGVKPAPQAEAAADSEASPKPLE